VIYNKDEFIECFNRLILQQKKEEKEYASDSIACQLYEQNIRICALIWKSGL
jgi:hypothetical protein